MTNEADDWQDTERRLSEMPEADLRDALAKAGVKAVLPSHKKARSSDRPTAPGERGDATSRWAAGEWQERISLDELPDAQKFLADPGKPPTVAQQLEQAEPLSTPPPARQSLNGALWGLLATAALVALGYFSVDADWFARPVVGARAAVAPAPDDRAAGSVPAPATARSASGSASSSAGNTGEQKPPTAEKPVAQAPAPKEEIGAAKPAGMAAAQATPAPPSPAANTKLLEKRAKRGSVAAMINLARIALQADDAATAVRWGKKAKAADSRSIDARIVLGDALMLAGEGSAAEHIWSRALARSPRNEALKQRLGK